MGGRGCGMSGRRKIVFCTLLCTANSMCAVWLSVLNTFYIRREPEVFIKHETGKQSGGMGS